MDHTNVFVEAMTSKVLARELPTKTIAELHDALLEVQKTDELYHDENGSLKVDEAWYKASVLDFIDWLACHLPESSLISLYYRYAQLPIICSALAFDADERAEAIANEIVMRYGAPSALELIRAHYVATSILRVFDSSITFHTFTELGPDFSGSFSIPAGWHCRIPDPNEGLHIEDGAGFDPFYRLLIVSLIAAMKSEFGASISFTYHDLSSGNQIIGSMFISGSMVIPMRGDVVDAFIDHVVTDQGDVLMSNIDSIILRSSYDTYVVAAAGCIIATLVVAIEDAFDNVTAFQERADMGDDPRRGFISCLDQTVANGEVGAMTIGERSGKTGDGVDNVIEDTATIVQSESNNDSIDVNKSENTNKTIVDEQTLNDAEKDYDALSRMIGVCEKFEKRTSDQMTIFDVIEDDASDYESHHLIDEQTNIEEYDKLLDEFIHADENDDYIFDNDELLSIVMKLDEDWTSFIGVFEDLGTLLQDRVDGATANVPVPLIEENESIEAFFSRIIDIHPLITYEEATDYVISTEIARSACELLLNGSMENADDRAKDVAASIELDTTLANFDESIVCLLQEHVDELDKLNQLEATNDIYDSMDIEKRIEIDEIMDLITEDVEATHSIVLLEGVIEDDEEAAAKGERINAKEIQLEPNDVLDTMSYSMKALRAIIMDALTSADSTLLCSSRESIASDTVSLCGLTFKNGTWKDVGEEKAFMILHTTTVSAPLALSPTDVIEYKALYSN